MNIYPIKPNEILERRKEQIPDFVIEVFNNLIAENYNGHTATIEQHDIVRGILHHLDFTGMEDAIYDNRYLDVEPIFEEAGWKVEYDKPGYNESYGAKFIFTKRVSN